MSYTAKLHGSVIVESAATTDEMEDALRRMVEDGDLDVDDVDGVEVDETSEMSVDTTVSVKFNIY